MESSAVLANIGIILAKDLLNDDRNHEKDISQLSWISDESSNEAEGFFFQLKQKKSMHKTKKKESKTTIDVNLLTLFNDKDFQRNLHIEKKTFLHILEKLTIFLNRNNFSTAMSSLSLSLWKLATDEHFEQISKRFGLPLFEAQNVIRESWRIISQNSKSFIEFPFKTEQMKQQMLAFQAQGSFNRLPGICGVIAVKKLDIFLESNDEEVQIIWQIIVNAHEKIIDVFVDLETNYNFESTPIYRMLEIKGFRPQQGYLVGDNNFQLRTYLMCPFQKPETENERAFNLMLQPAFLLAQNIFDKMAKRFNALYALESKDLFEVRRVISTICALHNICVAFGDNYVDQEKQNKNWSSQGIRLDFNFNNCMPSQAALGRRNNLLNELLGSDLSYQELKNIKIN